MESQSRNFLMGPKKTQLDLTVSKEKNLQPRRSLRCKDRTGSVNSGTPNVHLSHQSGFAVENFHYGWDDIREVELHWWKTTTY